MSLKLYSFWLLENGEWVEQEPIQAKNRKLAAESIRESKRKEGTWKLRLV